MNTVAGGSSGRGRVRGSPRRGRDERSDAGRHAGRPTPPSGRRRDGDGANVHAKSARDSEAEVGVDPDAPRDRGQRGAVARRGGDDPWPSQVGRARLGAGPGAHGRGAGGADLRTEGGDAGAADAGVRVPAHRAEEAGRDAGAAPPRVPGEAAGRLPVHPILRALPDLAEGPRPDDAAGAQGRREALRRLLGEEAAHRRPEDRRRDRGRAVRRGAGRVELHVRRGDAHAARPGLHREPPAGLPLPRWRDRRPGPRPAEERRGGGVPLRAGHAADLRGDGAPPRDGGAPSATGAPPRQGLRFTVHLIRGVC